MHLHFVKLLKPRHEKGLEIIMDINISLSCCCKFIQMSNMSLESTVQATAKITIPLGHQ